MSTSASLTWPTSPQSIPEAALRDVVVRSVGRATPALAAAVGKGLGLPVETVVRAVYRAPATLLQRVAPELAERLCTLLNATGLEVQVVPEGQAVDAPPLWDAAAHVLDAARVHEAAEALARFTGLSAAAAQEALLTPPGVVLGGVSAASIDALKSTLPDGVVELVAVLPQDSRYALHLLPCAEMVARGVLEDVRKLGLEPLAREGIIAIDLEHRTAQALWQRHSRTGALRLIHTAFLRYTLSLQGPLHTFNPAQAALLEERAGVPAEMLPHLLTALPVGLHEDVSHTELPGLMAAYAAVGLPVQADLSTFKRYTLELAQAQDRDATQRLLVQQAAWPAGHPLPALPCHTAEPLSRPRARQLQALLDGLGCDAYLEDHHG
ncbi:MAG: hypothetical protein U5L74_06020 [Ideonella sp.]|nr:hypothetical protein [Ideonella sp.]